MRQIGQLQDLDIYGYPTEPEEWQDDVQAICDNMNAYNCNQKKKLDVDTDAKQSSRNDDHWAQNKYTRRFQRFVEDWAFPDNHEAEEYDMTSVTMPISLFVAEKDSLCTLEWAEQHGDIVPLFLCA